MAFLTDRKRATGMGSAKSGTHHFWSMKVSSVALLFLVPMFIFTFGGILGSSYAEVMAYFATALSRDCRRFDDPCRVQTFQ